MAGTRVIEVKAAVLADNAARAGRLRQRLSDLGICLVNLMGSPGSGKTSLLAALLPLLSPPYAAAVVEADLDSRTDADALEALGWRAVQLKTGGFCHLDAAMVESGLAELGIASNAGNYGEPVGMPLPGAAAGGNLTAALDLVFLENVGNLICTAQVDTGAHLNLALLSVPEGDDKPLKYPVMFAAADIVIVTKADYLDRETFDTQAVAARVGAMNPQAAFFLVSARSGQGMDALAGFILSAISPYARC